MQMVDCLNKMGVTQMKHDEDMKIFQYGDNQWVTYKNIVDSLKSVGADQCDVLLLHTGITFGLPARELKRGELMSVLYDAINELQIKTLIFPTFTFSFSNHQVYDVKESKTKMGMLNEYIRKQSEAVRSIDPLMSFCVIGENKEIIKTEGKASLGKGSVFDNLHHTDNVKILFFGAKLEECFTYQHYVEEQLRVPYRYDKTFTGTIIDNSGEEYEDKYTLYVKYKNVVPFTPPQFEEELIKNGYFMKRKLGNSYVSCFSEQDAYRETKRWIDEDVNAFLAEPYDTKPLVKEYRYGNVTTVQ